jgi:hypothetical protein
LEKRICKECAEFGEWKQKQKNGEKRECRMYRKSRGMDTETMSVIKKGGRSFTTTCSLCRDYKGQ